VEPVANAEIQRQLTSGEVLLIDTRQHWVALIRFAFRPLLIAGVGVLLSVLNQWMRFDRLSFINDIIHWIIVVLFVVAIVWLPVDIVRWWSRHYVLTNRRAMRMDGVLRKQSFDSSLEQINDIMLSQSFLGRQLGYADLTLLTANASNEAYRQLLDGPQFKRAVLDAKDAIRSGRPLEALPDGFVVKGGTNAASMRSSSKGSVADDSGAAIATGTAAAAGASAAVTAEEADTAPSAPGDAPEAWTAQGHDRPGVTPIEDTGGAEAPSTTDLVAEDEAFAGWPESVGTEVDSSSEGPVAHAQVDAATAGVDGPDEMASPESTGAPVDDGVPASETDGDEAAVTMADSDPARSSGEDRPAT
jgi:hypothetical protein